MKNGSAVDMKTYPLIVGLTGTRGVGKNLLYDCLHQLDGRFQSYSFAGALKHDLSDLVKDNFGWDSVEPTPKQKEILRHLYIGWGMTCRAADEFHWIKKVDERIEFMAEYGQPKNVTSRIPTILDFRFKNEVIYFRNKYKDKFKLINITREGSPEPTDEEKKHFREVASMADYSLHWGGNTHEERLDKAHGLWEGINDSMALEYRGEDKA